jgi:hypothetical protein
LKLYFLPVDLLPQLRLQMLLPSSSLVLLSLRILAFLSFCIVVVLTNDESEAQAT